MAQVHRPLSQGPDLSIQGITMALPTPIHYWLVRLRALNRPVLWGGGLGFLLLGLVGQQYFSHPEWLRSFVPNETDPSRSTDSLSDLSQAELADLAEIDNLGWLLNQLQPQTASALDETPNPRPEASTDALALPRPTPLAAADDASPFAAYLERTQFRVSPATAEGADAAAAVGQGSLNRPRLGQATAPESPFPNPLQQLLAPSQPAAAPSEEDMRAGTTDDPASPPAASTSRPGLSSTSGLTPPPWAVEGTTPGVNQPFIRTTPEMSPPPGTTGYRPPPSLAPSAPTNGGLGLSPPAAAPLNLSPGVASPGVSAQSGPNSVGNTLPPPIPSSAANASGRPEAAPFSVPRPPGSNIGGGYIYTFSDPNGPVD